MNKEEYFEIIKNLKDKIGDWKISIDKYTKTNFVVGYYLSGEIDEYIVFINDEYEIQSVKKTTKYELEALEALLDIIKVITRSNV